MAELLGQIPAGKRCCLIERPGLVLQQRQVVQRVEHEVGRLIGTAVPGNHLTAMADHHLSDEALHHHVPIAVGRRHGIVVAAVADQAGRAHLGRASLASLEGGRRQLAKGGDIASQAHADRLILPPRLVLLAVLTADAQTLVQLVEVSGSR
jgi:nucleotide-binding universal stress UspA family protein